MRGAAGLVLSRHPSGATEKAHDTFHSGYPVPSQYINRRPPEIQHECHVDLHDPVDGGGGVSDCPCIRAEDCSCGAVRRRLLLHFHAMSTVPQRLTVTSLRTTEHTRGLSLAANVQLAVPSCGI
jgi:hypothetical protein